MPTEYEEFWTNSSFAFVRRSTAKPFPTLSYGELKKQGLLKEGVPMKGKDRLPIRKIYELHKPVNEIVALLSAEVDAWYTAGLETVSRGLSADQMAAAVERQITDVKLNAASTVADACKQVLAAAADNDRILIFGSFYTVAEASRFLARQVH